MTDIFISYSSKDRDWVARLAALFEAQGYSVWWDPDILPGQHYQDVIQKALHGAGCVVAVWTPDSVASDYVRAECLWAFNKRNLVGVLAREVVVPTPFNAIQAADLRQWKGHVDDVNLQRLLRGIGLVCNREVVAPPVPSVKQGGSGLKVAGFVGVLATAVGFGWYHYGNQPVEPQKLLTAPVVEAPVVVPEPADASTPKLVPKMVDIPGGSFLMGCDPKRDDVEGGCEDNEKPGHGVTLKPFKMAETEITVAQFREFVEKKNYQTTAEQAGSCWSLDGKGEWADVKGNSWRQLGFKQTDNDPVACVSWDDAQQYLVWLNEVTQPKKPYRLPTEAEWEYAARGGEGSKNAAYPWGDKASHEYANYGKDECCAGLENGKDKWVYTSPVGSFPANGFGLFDMHGNVWEWVQDWYGDGYYGTLPASSPEGPDKGTNRVFRGGSWSYTPGWLRSAYRGRNTPDFRLSNLGFRPAQDH